MSIGSFSRSLVQLMTGSALATLIATLSLPLLTRLFDPVAFGAYAMFTSAASVVGVIACLRYEATILLADDESQARQQLLLCMLIAVVIAALTLILLLGVSEQELLIRTGIEDTFIIYLLPLYLLLHGLNLAYSGWSNRRRAYRRLAATAVINQLALAAIAVTAGMLGFTSAAALILALVTARALSVFFLALRSQTDKPLHKPSVSALTAGLQRYRRFPLLGSWSALLSMASWQMPVLLLGALFSPAAAGLYMLGFRLLQAPMKLAGNAMSTVFLQQGAQARREGGLRSLVDELLLQIVRATLVPMAVIALLCPELFALVFGQQWREAGEFTRVLMPWAFLWFLTGPFTGLFSILEQQGLQLRWNILNFISRVLALLIGAYSGSLKLTIALLSTAGVAVYGYKLLITLRLADSSLSALRPCIPYAAKALFAAVAIGLLVVAKAALLLQLGLAVALLALYFGMEYRQTVAGLGKSFSSNRGSGG